MTSTLSGIINLNKPRGISSAQALYKVRALTGQRKSGHAGTLDPLATGVLILCLGKGTKLVESIMDQPKVYRATGRIDVTSETLDVDSKLVDVAIDDVPSVRDVLNVCKEFEGSIQQVPPRISAVKVNGLPAYERVRRNQEVQLKARPATVYWIHLHAYEFPKLDFEVCCGRGTYVRSLIRDIGARLGAGGCLTSLVRRRVGPFALCDASTLESLSSCDTPEQALIELPRAKTMLDPAAIEIPPRPDELVSVGLEDATQTAPRSS